MLDRRSGLGENRGLSLLSQKHLEAVASFLALRPPAQLCIDIESSIGLIGLYDVPSDRVSCQILDLKTGRVVLLVHEPDLEVVHLADMVAADSTEPYPW